MRPVKGQVDDLLEEIRVRAARNERVLVTTLTKRMAEDLAEYFAEVGVRCRYLHSEIDTLERVRILRDLRRGEFDVLIGINLLREGLDLPEVSLVAILDADKEGYLRSATSLIQTMGRCARHLEGRAILYADRMTDSMRQAIGETSRRRAKQEAYNRENNITPQSIIKSVDMQLAAHRRSRLRHRAGRRCRRSAKSPTRSNCSRPSRSSKRKCAKPPRISNSSAPPPPRPHPRPEAARPRRDRHDGSPASHSRRHLGFGQPL